MYEREAARFVVGVEYRDQFLEGGKAGLSGGQDAEKRAKELEKEIEKREQVIGELTIANRILKKKVDGSL